MRDHGPTGAAPAPYGHNRQTPHDHLHSALAEEDGAAELQVLTAQFIEGFAKASDKVAYLRIAGVPLSRPDPNGGPDLKLVDVRVVTEWQVGTASPSFGSRELSYLPFPGEMVSERTNLELVYVSLAEKRVEDIRHVLREARGARGGREGTGATG